MPAQSILPGRGPPCKCVKVPENASMRTRFAPAPTGHLHLGHVHNAIHVWEFAKSHGGRVILRIEDHDRQRARAEFEASIREDLKWLGFEPDEEAPRQSERGAAYRGVVHELAAKGLVYGCSCSRQEIAATGTGTPTEQDELRYPGTCRERGLALEDGRGWRVRMEPGAETFVDGILGSSVAGAITPVRRPAGRDRLGNWTYQFAVAIDDYLQDISHVIRGVDLFPSTGRQSGWRGWLGERRRHPFDITDSSCERRHRSSANRKGIRVSATCAARGGHPTSHYTGPTRRHAAA